MEAGDHWIPDDVAQWLDHIGIHQHQVDMMYGQVTQAFPGSIMQDESVAGPVLQRLMQENLCYGASGFCPENDGMPSFNSPASTETLLLETQPRQEPQGQEHQVDSNSMENNAVGVQNLSGGVHVSLAISELGDLELPSYEKAKSQSQLYKVQQEQNEVQNMTRTYTSLQNPNNTLINSTALKIPCHTPLNLQNPGAGQLYSSDQNHNDQTFSFLNPSQTQVVFKSNQQQGLPIPSYTPSSTSSCPPSLISAPSLSSCIRAEGCSWVQSGFTEADDGLSNLKKGHVRSLSERIMQVNLGTNGAQQPTETSQNEAEQMLASPASYKSTAPFLIPADQTFSEPRGPPPEYPLKLKAPTSYTSCPGQPSYEQTILSVEAVSGQIANLMPPCQPAHMAGPGTRLPPQGQIVPVEAFSMMGHAQHMMSVLNNENQKLRQELLVQTQKIRKLQRLETEVQRLSDAYESLVKTSSKCEALDKTMKVKMEEKIRRLHDFNRDLRDRLETANRQLANPGTEGREDANAYMSERRESLKELETLQVETESLRSANEDQRRHIEILEKALKNAQSKVVRLEEEIGRKNTYVERVERLQQALVQLQATCEEQEQLQKCRRTRLEKELETLRSQQRAGLGVCESSAPALLDLLREREERILKLEADRMRWEQKYLEESAMRQFTMEAAATVAAQRDTTIIQHSRSGSYSDACLWQHDEEDKTHNRCCQDIETRMKDLHAQLLEKIAMIKVLQQRSRRDPALLRPARSVPSIGGTGLHSRQASQTEGVLMAKQCGEHLPPSAPSFSASLSSLSSSLSSTLPHSFPPLSAPHLPVSSRTSSSSTLPHSSYSSLLLPSSSATLPLPSSHLHSLPPLPPNSSTSLPSTPLLSLHSKSINKDSSIQTKRSPDGIRTTPPTGRGKNSKTDSRTLPAAGQKIKLPDSDLVEILI